MFDNNYLVIDDIGEKEVLCMACSKVIKSRQEIPSKNNKDRFIYSMSQHADYKEIPVILSDGNISFLMVCDDCKFSDITEENAAKITSQISNALKSQLEHSGKSPDLIDEIIKNINRKVVRRAETSEAAKAMRGI